MPCPLNSPDAKLCLTFRSKANYCTPQRGMQDRTQNLFCFDSLRWKNCSATTVARLMGTLQDALYGIKNSAHELYCLLAMPAYLSWHCYVSCHGTAIFTALAPLTLLSWHCFGTLIPLALAMQVLSSCWLSPTPQAFGFPPRHVLAPPQSCQVSSQQLMGNKKLC